MMAYRASSFTSQLCLPLSLLLACGDSGGGSGDETGASITGISVTATASAGSTTGEGESDSESDSASAGTSAGTGTSAGSSSGASGSASDTAPKFDLGDQPDGDIDPCAGPNAEKNSYIWIPTTSDGTVSKINTFTTVEENRYNSGPGGGGESVSRTAVSGDGRFVVVNSRDTGRSTAFAANIADCIDRNGNGVIDTSINAADVRPWNEDECMIWSVVHGPAAGNHQRGPRGITWTLGDWNEATCSYINPKVWVGYLNGGNGEFARIDGQTGAVELTLQAPSWQGTGYSPYGGALDPQQRPWFTGLRGELMRINTDQDPISLTRIPQPGNIQTYGMTVDPDGNPWMAGCSGPVSTYDINAQTWISVAGTNACHRGMAIDHNGHGWIASNSPCGLVEIDTKSRTLVANHNLGQCSTAIGVSVDIEGYVWLVDQGGWAWKIDPLNVPAMQQVSVPGNHYVYSDMTGGQLKSVIVPPG